MHMKVYGVLYLGIVSYHTYIHRYFNRISELYLHQTLRYFVRYCTGAGAELTIIEILEIHRIEI